MNRCAWCLINEKMTHYHDEEWGVMLKDDQKQFDFNARGHAVRS